jgi:selenide, water dikinase
MSSTQNNEAVRLTQYSHGAGCGCKIAPQLLDEILKSNSNAPYYKNLLVGNNTKDDAAVFALPDGNGLISTTDFFMPIVDDPFQFGKIASANAISDVYAMGGSPIMAIAILGWPIDKLPATVAQQVLEGSRAICAEAGIPLAGGHSIDAPEPIFGLAVNGLVPIKNLKQNNTAKMGHKLYLTKKIGVGILTTAEKKGALLPEHFQIASQQMMMLNKIGQLLGQIDEVSAMTDVTGFGLLGHLSEMTEGSNLSATINLNTIPLLVNDLNYYINKQCVPGGTNRNWNSYKHKIQISPTLNKAEAIAILADPQTSGGLLIAICPSAEEQLVNLFKQNGLHNFIQPIGELTTKESFEVKVL